MVAEALIQGIVNALNEEFGEDYQYLTENNEQDLPAPCFLVSVEQENRELFHDRRYRRNHLVSVTYFPEPREVDEAWTTNAELNSVAARLFDCLEVIQANGHGIRGHEMNAEKSDGCLVFTMSFEHYEIKLIEVELMQTETTTVLMKEQTIHGKQN